VAADDFEGDRADQVSVGEVLCSPRKRLLMAHTSIVIVLFFAMLVLPCYVASRIDLDEEEASSGE